MTLLNNPAVAALGFRGYSPADSRSWCPQGFASNCISFEGRGDSSSLTAVKSAYIGILKGAASCPGTRALV